MAARSFITELGYVVGNNPTADTQSFIALTGIYVSDVDSDVTASGSLLTPVRSYIVYPGVYAIANETGQSYAVAPGVYIADIEDDAFVHLTYSLFYESVYKEACRQRAHDQGPAVDKDEQHDFERQRDQHRRQHHHAHRHQHAGDHQIDHKERNEKKKSDLERLLQLRDHEAGDDDPQGQFGRARGRLDPA